MYKKITTVLIIFVAVVFSSYWAGYSFGKDKDPVYKELDIFAETLAIVEKKHVKEKNPKELIYGAMQGMLSSLDAYSQFLNPEEYKDLLTETEGEFGGLGIEITLKDGMLTIVTAMEDTPASKAGLRSGDIIVKINGEITRSIALNDAVKKLRGDAGSKVDLTVLHDNDTGLKDVTVVRDMIKIKDIKHAMVLENNIGYLKIAEFREKTSDDLDLALKGLQEKHIKGLIIDVRNNPGGLLYSAIDVASKFLEQDKAVVSTRTRNEPEQFYKAKSGDVKILDIPMVVLINKGSASGSEILAAALRENNRAVLVGETTFGKGSVQTIIPLSDGSALRLTTSTYYTPKGTCIHEKGINPDVEIADSAREEEDNMKEDIEAKKKDKEEEVFNKVKDKQEKVAEKKVDFDYKKDNQLMRALDLIKGLAALSNNDKK